MYQLVRCWSIPYTAFVHLGRRDISLGWHIRLITVQTSENVRLHVFKYSLLCSFICGLVSNSQTSENVWALTLAATPTRIDALCLAYTHVFYPSVSVGSSVAGSLSTVFHIGRTENDVNLFFLPNPFSFVFIHCYISLYLRVFVLAYSRMDFGVKTLKQMFSDVVQLQLNTSLFSQFTALEKARVIIAGFRPKLTGVF